MRTDIDIEMVLIGNISGPKYLRWYLEYFGTDIDIMIFLRGSAET